MLRAHQKFLIIEKKRKKISFPEIEFYRPDDCLQRFEEIALQLLKARQH